jgi:hypothetical protein
MLTDLGKHGEVGPVWGCGLFHHWMQDHITSDPGFAP